MDPEFAFKYCLRCGTEVDARDRVLDCAACGYTYYLNPFTAVNGLLVNDKSQLLLTKRARDPHKDTWDIPGGFMEVEETLEEGLQRELKEELGIDTNQAEYKYFCSSYDRYLFKGVKDYVIAISYIVNVGKVEQEFTVEDDISDARFFSKEDIPYDDIHFASVKNIVADFFTSEN